MMFSFLKYSKKDLERAGDSLRDPELVIKDEDAYRASIDIISNWRQLHIKPMNDCFTCLEAIVNLESKGAFLAKRLKRTPSIQAKLIRQEKMALRGMQDIGGCRVVVANEKQLRKVVRRLKKNSHFRKLGGGSKTWDYIGRPKESGYRSYHIIGWFPDAEGELRKIEVQLRTNLQHYWATALEIVDLCTASRMKFGAKDLEWSDFFCAVSKGFTILGALHRYDSMNNEERLKEFSKFLKYRASDDEILVCKEIARLEGKLKAARKFEAFANSIKYAEGQIDHKSESGGYTLVVVDIDRAHIRTTFFEESQYGNAEVAFSDAEKDALAKEGHAVALLSTSALGGLREAYPNYFADSEQFFYALDVIKACYKRVHGGVF